MHSRSNPLHGAVAHGIPRVGAGVAMLLLTGWGVALLAWVTPGIVKPFTRPCAGCYLGAFGPPLEPYGLPTRRTGETGAGNAAPSTGHGADTAAGGASGWLDLRDTVAVDRSALFGTGRISQDAAAFFARNDGGTPGEAHAVDDDFRQAFGPGWFASDTVGDAPVQGDTVPRRPWDGGTLWGPSVNRLDVTTTAPVAGVSAQSGGEAVTGGGVASKADRPVSWGVPRPEAPAADIDAYWNQRVTPSWHVAVVKDLQDHFLQIGRYGTDSGQASAGSRFAGLAETVTDTGADANYQFVVNPGGAISDRLSADAAMIHEARLPGGGYRQPGRDGFDTFRASAAWSIGETVTPAIRYFRAAGSPENSPDSWPARPNSAGIIAEVAYAPWGTWAAPIQFLNLRIAARYVAYTEVNGTGRGASGNNAMALSLFGALHF